MSNETDLAGAVRRFGRQINAVAFWPSKYNSTIVRLFSIVLGLAAWQLYAAGQPPYLFPTLDAIFAAFVEQVNEWNLVSRFLATLKAMFTGYVIAAVVGILVGLVMGLDDRIAAVFNPYINAMYVAPVSALVPLLILIGGPTFTVRAFVVFLFCVFEIIVDTYEGIETTPQGLLEVSRSFGAGTYFEVRHVIVPHDLPYITAGLRLGIGRAVSGVILAEVLVQFVNLGALVREWSELFRIAGVLSVVLLLMILSIVLTRAIQLLESWLIDWDAEVNL